MEDDNRKWKHCDKKAKVLEYIAGALFEASTKALMDNEDDVSDILMWLGMYVGEKRDRAFNAYIDERYKQRAGVID